MKAYVLCTGVIFGLIVVAHIARMVAEGPHVMADPFMIALTALAAGLCIWGMRLFFRSK